MTTESGETGSKRSEKKTKRGKYIPNLAEFYFRPTYDWSVQQAKKNYEQTSEKLGDFELDTVYFEDCVIGLKAIPDSSIDLVIADPPFGIDFDGKSGAYNRKDDFVVSGYEEVDEPYSDFTLRWMEGLPRIIGKHGSVWVFSGWNNLESILHAARIVGLETLNHLIWKYPFGVYTRKKFVTSHYHLLLFVKNIDEYFFNKIEHYPQDVWEIRRRYRAGQRKNSTKLPLEVVERCIDFSSKPGDVVLDPFMGNGTTAVAAKSNWRHFLGFEINENLKDVIRSQISSVRPGDGYTPYTMRLPSVDELAEKYPKAYKEYLKRERQNE